MPVRVPDQYYLPLMEGFIQFFNIKQELAMIASLLRKINIFVSIKPLKFAAIYAAAAAENGRMGMCEI
jgi:hypothetical protein